MGSDKSSPRLSRPRLLPGALADLKDALWGLYLDADAPSLDRIRARIDALDEVASNGNTAAEMPGVPNRDTIRDVISGPRLPARAQSVIAVAAALVYYRATNAELARASVAGHPVIERVRRLWQLAASAQHVGRLISELSPQDLEVHTSVTEPGVAGLRVLPPYIDRAHDLVVRHAVANALAGRSGMVVLRSDSTSGKTRACFQALYWTPDQPHARSLAEAGWRLWPSAPPASADVALEELKRVGPRTVVWLNEAQRFLLDSGPDKASAFAAILRELLMAPDTGPILVLGTLWPTYWNILTGRPEPGQPDTHATVRHLLATSSQHEVAPSFTRKELDAARATGHPDLVEAVDHAESGMVTQYLGGVPDLLERYRTADAVSRALLHAAMDLRDLGHNEQLPIALLAAAVHAYLLPDQLRRAQRDPNWLHAALASLTRLGVADTSPLEPMDHHAAPTTATHYRLADALHEHGRETRLHIFPADPFWRAIGLHASSANQAALASAADRGYRRNIAQQLYRHAADAGNATAMVWLAQQRMEMHDLDGAAEMAQRATKAGDSSALLLLAGKLAERGDHGRAEQLFHQAADAGNVEALIRLSRQRNEAGDRDEAKNLAVRAADAGDGQALVEMIRGQEEMGDRDDADHLLHRLLVSDDVNSAAWAAAWLAERADQDSAERVLRQAAAVGSSQALAVLAHRRDQAGDRDGAASLLHQLIDIGETGALLNLTLTWEQTGDFDKAEHLAQRAAAAGNTVALEVLAKQLEQRGQHAHAERLMWQAVAFGGNGALFNIAYERVRAGEYEKAEQIAQKAAAGGDVAVLTTIAWWLEDADDHGRAERLLQQAADAGSIDALFVLACRRAEVGDENGAEHLAQQAADAGNTVALEWLIHRRAATGNLNGARQALMLYLNVRARRRFPGFNEDEIVEVFERYGIRVDDALIYAP